MTLKIKTMFGILENEIVSTMDKKFFGFVARM